MHNLDPQPSHDPMGHGHMVHHDHRLPDSQGSQSIAGNPAEDMMLEHGLDAGTEEVRREEPFKAAGLTDDQMLVLRFGNKTNISISLGAAAYAAAHHELWWFLGFCVLALLPLECLIWITRYREAKRAEQAPPDSAAARADDKPDDELQAG